jgi:hypothetical protein
MDTEQVETPANSEALDAFSKLYAVVLDHWAGAGRRVRWSPTHAGWLRNSDYSRYLQSDSRWLSAPAQTFDQPDGPTGEEFDAAAELAFSVTEKQRPWYCDRCWNSEPSLHFIAPDIYGDPQAYCVQAPSYSVVGSSGGQGLVKHWGSPFGCRSVQSHIDWMSDANGPYTGPAAAYLYGQPLPAEEVIGREWCSHCSGAAHNVRSSATRGDESEAGRAEERAKRDLRRLRRELGEYYGD